MLIAMRGSHTADFVFVKKENDYWQQGSGRIVFFAGHLKRQDSQEDGNEMCGGWW